jgi:tetratricopeptide (TPR) repeat protein
MPVLYGEGKTNAIYRLRKEITEAMGRDLPNYKSKSCVNIQCPQANCSKAKNKTWMVSFDQNPSFTGREFELQRIRQMLFTGRQTVKVAITGLGGVGKTQLALELAYRIRAENKDCSVIWIPATSKESLEQAYLNAARLLGIPGWEDEKADIKRLVQDYLSDDSAGQWLLVIDNADDISMWIDQLTPDSSRLMDCLPRSKYGSIIFTTRDKKAAIKLAGPANRNVVEVLELDEASAKQLLQKYLSEDLLDDQQYMMALLNKLANLPLAITQAAAYINANCIDLATYVSLLEDQEDVVIDLLSEDFEDEGRYRDLKNPVATTWLISFEQIRQRDPLAADYLSFMACVDAKDIPQSLLPPGPSRKKEIDAMGTLQGYSFITKGSAGSSNPTDLAAMNIHRLVHMATRNWLQTENILADWTRKAIVRLLDVIGDVSHDNRVAWRSYMPHASYVLGSNFASEDDENRLDLLEMYGICLRSDGRYQEAEMSFKQVMERRKAKLGEDHPDTLISMTNLALTLSDQGQWEEAEKLELQVTESHKMKLGADHPSTLTSINNLASSLLNQGRWEEAERLCVQVMETSKAKLGVDHPDTLISIANLAMIYKNQGRWEEAEKLNVQVIESRKVKLGADHPSTLTSMNNLASIYGKQSRWEEAEKLYIQAMETSKAKLGADHPDTLIRINNLALMLLNQGRWDEAEELNIQVINISKAKLVEDHPITLTSIHNLAITYGNQGRWEEAEKLFLQVIESRETKLRPDHPDTLTSMSNLAFTWKSQGKHAEALELMVRSAQARQRVLGPEHPDTLSSLTLLEEWKS